MARIPTYQGTNRLQGVRVADTSVVGRATAGVGKSIRQVGADLGEISRRREDRIAVSEAIDGLTAYKSRLSEEKLNNFDTRTGINANGMFKDSEARAKEIREEISSNMSNAARVKFNAQAQAKQSTWTTTIAGEESARVRGYHDDVHKRLIKSTAIEVAAPDFTGSVDDEVIKVVAARNAQYEMTEGEKAIMSKELTDKFLTGKLLREDADSPELFLKTYKENRHKLSPASHNRFDTIADAAQEKANMNSAREGMSEKHGNDFLGAYMDMNENPNFAKDNSLTAQQVASLESDYMSKHNFDVARKDRKQKENADKEYGAIFDAETPELAEEALENATWITKTNKQSIKEKLKNLSEKADLDKSNKLYRDIDGDMFDSEKGIYDRALEGGVGSARQYVEYWRATKGYNAKEAKTPNFVSRGLKYFDRFATENPDLVEKTDFIDFEHALRSEVERQKIDPSDLPAVNKLYKELTTETPLTWGQALKDWIPLVNYDDRLGFQQVADTPEGAAYSGINPETNKMEYFDSEGNKL